MLSSVNAYGEGVGVPLSNTYGPPRAAQPQDPVMKSSESVDVVHELSVHGLERRLAEDGEREDVAPLVVSPCRIGPPEPSVLCANR